MQNHSSVSSFKIMEKRNLSKNTTLTVEEIMYFRGFPAVFLHTLDTKDTKICISHSTSIFSHLYTCKIAFTMTFISVAVQFFFQLQPAIVMIVGTVTQPSKGASQSMFLQPCNGTFGLLSCGDRELSDPSVEAVLPSTEDENRQLVHSEETTQRFGFLSFFQRLF